jgi:undecaprenyl diphosphate synthase
MSSKPTSSSIPTHIGYIMDGNRRWAKAQGKLPMQGHEAGVDAFYRVVRASFDMGAKYVSAFTFSTENWSRTKDEVSFLMKLVPKVLRQYLKDFHKDGIRIVVLGTRDNLPKDVIKAIEESEQMTKDNTNGTVALCFNYGGRQELVDMIKSIVRSGTDVETLSVDTIFDHLYHPDIPPCDLIVRTSGEHRLSGFMLPRSEYAEFIFEDKYWPDIQKEDVANYIEEYTTRSRRFGS